MGYRGAHKIDGRGPYHGLVPRRKARLQTPGKEPTGPSGVPYLFFPEITCSFDGKEVGSM